MDVVFGGMFILGFLNFARGNLEAFPLQILVLTGPWKARKLVYIYICNITVDIWAEVFL